MQEERDRGERERERCHRNSDSHGVAAPAMIDVRTMALRRSRCRKSCRRVWCVLFSISSRIRTHVAESAGLVIWYITPGPESQSKVDMWQATCPYWADQCVFLRPRPMRPFLVCSPPFSFSSFASNNKIKGCIFLICR